jgi:hypothetical protein
MRHLRFEVEDLALTCFFLSCSPLPLPLLSILSFFFLSRLLTTYQSKLGHLAQRRHLARARVR